MLHTTVIKASSLLTIMVIVLGCSKPQPPAPNVSKTFQLTSPAFADNQPIPAKYSHDGGNMSPPLNWNASPSSAKSLALIVEDPDAPGPTPFTHWIVFNIPTDTVSIPEGAVPAGALQGKNDGGTIGYYGPKPPSGIHHYIFRLYALDAPLPLAAGASKADVVNAMKGHELGMGKLTGLYSAVK